MQSNAIAYQRLKHDALIFATSISYFILAAIFAF